MSFNVCDRTRYGSFQGEGKKSTLEIHRFDTRLIINIKVEELDGIWNDLGMACQKKRAELDELLNESNYIQMLKLQFL